MTQANSIYRAINTFMDQHLPQEAHIPFYAILIPTTLEVCFRVIRRTIYKKMEKNDDDLPEINKWLDRRKKIIVGFIGLELVQTVAFLKFSLSNRWFLFPACYTFSYFAWTVYCYKQEGQSSAIYKTMDGDVQNRQPRSGEQ